MGSVACCYAHGDGKQDAAILVKGDVLVPSCEARATAAAAEPGAEGDVEDQAKVESSVVKVAEVPVLTDSTPSAAVPLTNAELVIMLERRIDDHMGLHLDSMDGFSAFVDDILPGAVRVWNCFHPPHMNLQVYDRIVEVNGVRGEPSRLLDEMKASTLWVLTIQRPTLIRVVVRASLGLDLKYSPKGRTFLISEVNDGTVKEWNQGPQEFKVQRNDRIVGISGAGGTLPGRLSSAAESEILTLAILHYD